ncbi:type II toxin-antitoxin system RelE/ParE family toxin [Xanthobacter autotrophicus]|uniref:type II toxin-antitoxin system RelE/ParE family toxin n=1 Tax=Xanthobacter autotrophicus TaxID=280 RepID=UPI00372C9C6B
MSNFRLTRQAEDDLLDIFLYGIEQFGRAQALHCKDDLDRCFAALVHSPRMGRLAPALGETVRRHEHASHVILYEIEDGGGILILAIVHGRSIRHLKI